MSEYSDAQKAFIVQRVRKGLSAEIVCKTAGIDMETFMDWWRQFSPEATIDYVSPPHSSNQDRSQRLTVSARLHAAFEPQCRSAWPKLVRRYAVTRAGPILPAWINAETLKIVRVDQLEAPALDD